MCFMHAVCAGYVLYRALVGLFGGLLFEYMQYLFLPHDIIHVHVAAGYELSDCMQYHVIA